MNYLNVFQFFVVIFCHIINPSLAKLFSSISLDMKTVNRKQSYWSPNNFIVPQLISHI